MLANSPEGTRRKWNRRSIKNAEKIKWKWWNGAGEAVWHLSACVFSVRRSLVWRKGKHTMATALEIVYNRRSVQWCERDRLHLSNRFGWIEWKGSPLPNNDRKFSDNRMVSNERRKDPFYHSVKFAVECECAPSLGTANDEISLLTRANARSFQITSDLYSCTASAMADGIEIGPT